MTPLYKQQKNECAPAACLYAIGIHQSHIHPLDLGNEAAAIDQLPGRNMDEGGTQIDVCLYLLKKKGLIRDYANIGANWDLLADYFDAGGCAVVSVPSQATTGGRKLRHAVAVDGTYGMFPFVYDPAQGDVVRWANYGDLRQQITTDTLMPQVYIMDYNDLHFIREMRKETWKRYTIFVAAGLLLVAALLYTLI